MQDLKRNPANLCDSYDGITIETEMGEQVCERFRRYGTRPCSIGAGKKKLEKKVDLQAGK